MKKKPMAETYAQVKARKRREFIENALWSIGAVFFMVVGGYALAGAWLGL
jgi:hypothetical protein